jgi:hypothetical protein
METTAEKITSLIEEQLKDAAHWFGGYDELRKIIDMLEDNAKEKAFDQHNNR